MTERAPLLMRHDLEAKIVQRCWEDDEFRQEFIADPVAVFMKYLHIPAAKLPSIIVHEEAPGTWHIVLPAKPSTSNQLSDEELEMVAGGMTTVVCLSLVSGVAATASASIVSTVTANVSVEAGGW